MAAEFTTLGSMCEAHGCEEVADLAYSVMTKKKLCKVCIDKTRGSLYCKNHDKEMELFCQTHITSMCHEGALKDHRDKTCVHRSIEDVIGENAVKLQDLLQRIIERGLLWRDHGDQIHQCRIDVDDHLKSVKEDMDSFIDDEKRRVNEEERENAAKINQDIDERNEKLLEKIRENDRVREERLEQNEKDAEEQRALGEKKRSEFYADLESIVLEVEQPIAKLEKSRRDASQALENVKLMVEDVLQDKQKTANEENRVSTSATDVLEKSVDKDRVGHITSAVSTIRFAKCPGREKYNGRIVWCGGEWSLMDEMKLEEVTLPAIVGCLDRNHVVITDRSRDNRHTYVLDMNTKQTTRVITGTDASYVSSCAPLMDKIVTGETRRGPLEDVLPDCVKVYNRQWKPIQKVSIPLVRPLLNQFSITWMIVAVDQDEMIIAAQNGGHEIFVINPARGNIIKTITCEENVMISGVLASGDIYARPSPPNLKVLILDRQSHQREIPVGCVNLWNTFIDPTTDDLYTVASTECFKRCVIDQLRSGSEVDEKGVVSYVIRNEPTFSREPYHLSFSRVMIMPSGDMIASDKYVILRFKKKPFAC